VTTIVTAAALARDVQEFVRFKRAMGMGYRRTEFVLNSFVRFVGQHWGDRCVFHAIPITDSTANRSPIPRQFDH
jgi:hypothetical protein